MDDGLAVERGMLTAPAEAWDLAVRRAGVIGRLAEQEMVGAEAEAADAASAGLGVSRRQVYDALLRQVQIDHTPADVIVVDERHRLPAGRPYLTAAIDVASRSMVGLVVTLEVPSATSVGSCLAHMATGTRAWLEQLGIEAVWPMRGKPRELYLDNAAEFKSEALRRGCEQHGIAPRYRPPGEPHFGGIVERVIGTMMQMVHELPGTTFSSVGERGDYDSGARAAMTLRELQRWLALAVACYHGEVHETLGRTPAAPRPQCGRRRPGKRARR